MDWKDRIVINPEICHGPTPLNHLGVQTRKVRYRNAKQESIGTSKCTPAV